MLTPLHQVSIDLLLDAMSQTAGTGFRASFMYGRPDDPLDYKGFGTEIYFNTEKLTRAALFLRESGPAYLKYMPIDDVRKILQDFIIDNYWYISEEWFFKRFDGTYAENISVQTRDILAEKIAVSDIFQPRSDLTLFPLIPVTVESSFTSEIFFYSSTEKLMADAKFSEAEARYLVPERFPLTKSWNGRIENPTSWLGVRAPAYQAAKKYRSIALGALALTQTPRCLYICSGRKMFGGHCTISENYETSFGNAHTPPLMENIVLTERDHAWLEVLSELLSKADRQTRKKLRALEYFYRAWFLDPSDRFAILCMCLDSPFGDPDQATQSVIDGVRETLGERLDIKRLRLLMKLRNSVIHGGAPEVYDSSKYAKYYKTYETDPIRDLELVVSTVLRKICFDQTLVEHDEPDAQFIELARTKGIIPNRLDDKTILADLIDCA